MLNEQISAAISSKLEKDIYIIGKGASIDSFDLKKLSDNIIINTNDSELLILGDICTFHYGWVLDVLEQQGAKASLYFTDKHLPEDINHYRADYIPNNPENADFVLQRFLSDST